MKFTEYVIVRDYGKQGLALFDMTTRTNPGNVSCWSTVMNYEDREKGFRPDLDAPMCFEEVPMSYYQQGMLVRPDTRHATDVGLAAFVERYKQWAIQGYSHHGPDVELEIVIVQKDQEKYRRERWAR